MQDRLMLAICILAAAVFVFVVAHTPILLLANASGDDALFINLGAQIASGNYLGPYHGWSLSKGPGYPLFLAASHWTGLPITVSQALLMVIAVGWFGLLVAKAFRSAWIGAAVFTLTILHPAFLVERILRDAIYGAQTLLVISGAIATFVVFQGRSFRWGVLTGILLAWFWLTREEGIWMIPGLVVIILGAALCEWKVEHSVRNTIVGAASLAAAFLVGHMSYPLANYFWYGAFQGIDIKERNFQAALSAVQSVRDGAQIPYIPVSRTTREYIYKVSPTFARMRETLDPPSDIDTYGRFGGCKFYGWTCGDIAGGWFIWSLKYAAHRAGAYKTPIDAQAFFAKLATEVQAACDTGQLHCESNPIPFMPNVSNRQLEQIPVTFLKALNALSDVEAMHLSPASRGTPEQIGAALLFLNYPPHVAPGDTWKQSSPQRVALKIRSYIGFIYSFFLATIAYSSILIFPVILWFFLVLKKYDFRIVIVVSLWVLIFSRISIIALIDISAFPAINEWYLIPAYYLLVPAGALSLVIFTRLAGFRLLRR